MTFDKKGVLKKKVDFDFVIEDGGDVIAGKKFNK